MRYSQCVICNEMVGWIGLVVNFGLSALKLFVGIISGSNALVADSLYSGKDVVTSVLIIVGLKVSKQPIDSEHPFGHGKVEFILSLAVSLVLIGLTVLLFLFCAESLWEGKHKPPHLIALWTAIVSVAVSYLSYGYTKCVGFEINSPMVSLLSNHHKSDGVSSLSVAFGIIGSHYLGMPWLDTVVALLETIHLIILGSEVFWDAFQGVMDSAAPKEVVSRIKSAALDVVGVDEIIEVRTRRVGQELWISMVVGVNPDMEVADAKLISHRVEETLAATIPHVGDVGVHCRSRTGSVPEFLDIQRELSLAAEEGTDS